MVKKKTIKIEMTENQILGIVFAIASMGFLITAAYMIVLFFSIPILFGVGALSSFLFIMYGSHLLNEKSNILMNKDKN